MDKQLFQMTLDDCNVVWSSPSDNSFGSMPLGNGDVGINLWVDGRGDLLFYISKVDAFDDRHLLPKLGRVCMTMEPPLPVDVYTQTLVLRDGAIEIVAGDVHLRAWVDANNPMVVIQGTSGTPRTVTLTVEALRPWADAAEALPDKGTVGLLFTDDTERLAWCYRNQSSAWGDNFRHQNTPDMVAKTRDPILHRTSGCVVQGAGFTRTSPTALRQGKPSTTVACSVRVLSSQPATIQDWLRDAFLPVMPDWSTHQAWWKAFWERSHIFVTGCGQGTFNLDQCRFNQIVQGARAYEGHKAIDARLNAFQLSQRYALERFCEAAASRGAVPPPFNGSIFTMDMPAGVLGFNAPKTHAVSPDGRDWADLSFMWQNTRHPYWSMVARGDYDTLRPGMQFVRDGLDICRDHCRKIFNLDGACIFEASWWHNVSVFNWKDLPAHLRYHQLASLELPAIMCEYVEHTQDRTFLEGVLLPCADEFIRFYEQRFPKRDVRGMMIMDGMGCAETYQGVTNLCTEIGCLKFLLGKLLSFDIDATRRQHWTKLLGEMPGVPLRRIRGMDLLAVGEKYDPGRQIVESPELYSIYPFRQAWLGTPALLSMARQSFHVRTTSLDGTVDGQAVETGGWQSAPVQAAYLGLAREAARLASINFNDRFIHWTDNVDPAAPFPSRPRARFPAFWECKMDGTPDNDHGANSVNALQSMLLQSDGKKIHLLPAWPEDWDVSFTLCAPFNTTVACVYREGRVQSLTVIPESRRKDVIDFSTPEQRIRTLIEVALADRNHLFGLPPMLDARPVSGPVTAAWLAKYGECLDGTMAGPWPGCLYKGNIIYACAIGQIPQVPDVAATLVAKKTLTAVGDGPVAILKLEYDRSLDAIASAAPSIGSLTVGKVVSDGVIDLGRVETFDRMELSIDNPGHRRGQVKSFVLQARQADGAWCTVYQGRIFGTIHAKRFAPVTAQVVRLIVTDAVVKQWDLFPNGK